MKRLLYILFFLASASMIGQASNAPDVVFPLVEQFISESHAHKVPVYHKIRKIDSIALTILPYPLTGLHLESSTYESISIHKGGRTARSIERSFYHEVGHVLGLGHDPRDRQIMNSQPEDVWFIDDKNWQRAKDEYFEQLKNKL